MSNSTYKIKVLRGTSDYVKQELLTKYPKVSIVDIKPEEIKFISDIMDVEVFRNLYSPTHITNPNGKTINLSRRDWRKAYVSAGINPSVAYIMCMIAELDKDDIVYDPFCGSSTIPITAFKYFDVKRVLASDISGKALLSSRLNFTIAKVPKEKYKLFRSDISKVILNKQNIDKIITNLPFGIRVGTHEQNILLYSSLERLANKLLRKKGQIILLSQEKTLVRNTFKDWKVKNILRVDEGGLLPEIFLIERKS